MGFYLSYYGLNLKPFKQKLASVVMLGAPSLRFRADHIYGWQPPPDQHISLATEVTAGYKWRAPGPVKIGFVSRNFYDHSTGKWLLGLVRDLSRPAFHVTVVMLPPRRDDALALSFEAAADVVIIPESDTLYGCREAVASLGLDVLIYADIGMDAISYALGFSRLAPIQVRWDHNIIPPRPF
jgi:protein O-GlcNAc transferase